MRLLNEAPALRNRQEFQRSHLTELANADFEAWAKESFEIAPKFTYRNDGRIGIPRGGNRDCTMNRSGSDNVPRRKYRSASRIANRRMILAGYRLADLLTTAKRIQPRQIEERNRNSNDTRIFSPHTVPRLCVTIGRYLNLFKRLTPVRRLSIYRFEHIVADSSFKALSKQRERLATPTVVNLSYWTKVQ